MKAKKFGFGRLSNLMKIKSALFSLAFIIINAGLNIAIYTYGYQKLTFPYLSEGQRMESVPYIFYYVMPAFTLVSISSFFVLHYLKKIKK